MKDVDNPSVADTKRFTAHEDCGLWNTNKNCTEGIVQVHSHYTKAAMIRSSLYPKELIKFILSYELNGQPKIARMVQLVKSQMNLVWIK